MSTDQGSWDYWKREWHLYQSLWLHQLSGPLVVPRCLATGEILAEIDEELAWIAMEDLRLLIIGRGQRAASVRLRSTSASSTAPICAGELCQPTHGAAETDCAAGPN